MQMKNDVAELFSNFLWWAVLTAGKWQQCNCSDVECSNMSC